MKKILTLIAFCLGMMLTQDVCAQAQKTFVKSINIEGQEVYFDLDGDVHVTEWDKDFVRVNTTVDVLNFNEDILNRLFQVGRYSIEYTTKNGRTVVTMPKLNTHVSIRGTDLQENVMYEISVPKGLIYTIKKSAPPAAAVN